MIGVTKIANAAAAFAYYKERDDYYLADKSSAEWYGKGATMLGLSGDIDPKVFHALLAGTYGPTAVANPDRHTPGWDITFSVPKSVSVAGLVEGDKGWISAHDRAVRTAIDYIEKHAAVTRQRGVGGAYEWRNTGNVAAALVRHATSRDGEPQLHTHAIVANRTRDPVTGKWVSIDSRQGLYAIQVAANNVYMNELASYARERGEAIEWRVNSSGAISFDLARIPREVIDGFSSRKAAIDAALAARGTDREHASAEERQAAAFDTRSPKEHLATAEWHRRWTEWARELGYTPEPRPAMQDSSFFRDKDTNADAAITQAVAHISERQTRFTERALLEAARQFAQGRAQDADLVAAVARAHESGTLLERETEIDLPGNQRGMVAGFTTAKGVRIEQSMLDRARQIARSGMGQPRIGETFAGQTTRGAIDALIARREAETGHTFTTEQRVAVRGILESESGLHITQGSAGTAKTTTMLAALADHARAGGWQVLALAPTHDAADVLGEAIGANAGTVAAAINSRPTDAPSRQLWIIDEASLIGASDLNKLFGKAALVGARVLLVGDWRQIGSVQAGAVFRQLIDAYGRAVHLLTDIKRQTSAQLRAAVYDTIAGRPSDALSKVQVIENTDTHKGVEAIADDYMRAVAAGKSTLVVTLSQLDRDAVNSAIQGQREAVGEVTDAREIVTLAAKGWTEAEQADAARYLPGDVIEAGRNFTRGPSRGELAKVVNVEGGKITAQRSDGALWTFDPRRTRNFSVLDVGKTRMGAGDRIVAKGAIVARDTNGCVVAVKNRTALTVQRIADDGQIDVTNARGRTLTIDAKQGAKLALAYAQTANQAQGRTVDVAIAYMRSTQRRLADQQRAYVALSRARETAIVHTDDKAKLAKQIERHSGQKETATVRRLDAIHPEVGDAPARHQSCLDDGPEPWKAASKPTVRDRARGALTSAGKVVQRGVYAVGAAGGKLGDALDRFDSHAPRRQYDRETKKILCTIEAAAVSRRKGAAYKRSALTGKITGKRSIVNPVRIVKAMNATAHARDAAAKVKGQEIKRHAGWEAHEAGKRVDWRDPKDGKLLVRTSDGRTARSTDRGKTWREETGIRGLVDRHQARVQAQRDARLDADRAEWRAAGWRETRPTRELARAALESYQRDRDRLLPMRRDWDAMADRYGVEYDRDGRRYSYDKDGHLHAEALTSRAYVMERTKEGRAVRQETEGHTAGVIAGMGARREIERAIEAGRDAEVARLEELAEITPEIEKQAEREIEPLLLADRVEGLEERSDLDVGQSRQSDRGRGPELDAGA